jgi:hypothetical protein
MIGIKTMMGWVAASLIVAAPAAAQTTDTLPSASSTPPPFTAADSARYLELGHRVARWYFGGAADSIYAIASEETRQAMGDVAGLAQHMARVTERLGSQALVLEEKLTRREGKPQFWHEALFTAFTDEPVVLRVVFNHHGDLVGLGISPSSQAVQDR